MQTPLEQSTPGFVQNYSPIPYEVLFIMNIVIAAKNFHGICLYEGCRNEARSTGRMST
jgi:hypothetical protein